MGKEFFKLFGNIIMMLGVIMASFLLLINLYHYRDISHVYAVDTNDSASLKNIKDNIKKSEKLMSMDVSKVSASKIDAAGASKKAIDNCIKTFKDSDLYKLSGVHEFKYYDNYRNMGYLYTKVSSDCNSMMKYSMESHIGANSGVKTSYDNMIDDYTKMFDVVSSNASYIEKKSLNTNSYSFTSEMNRFSIFDDLRSDTEFTLNNYETVSSLILDLSTWYSNTFGGDLNE